ncbi:CaiB/BaiF CoA transferase family protein [Paraburkholderia sabiae]|uniref:CoA transferase n=1 Tax=Paraburkholderia sabiae TaxID=273251 RepID=A0ABU9QI39_9BURK|nr:CoA transferase [Paraburkholderia sabiae]WJZ77496.1 CoA transferase [Paraburkholderia sabiae]CAD6558045.1 Acetyl-CoA:oxalate CoA-transferase [Paraburkholderia sabiae]
MNAPGFAAPDESRKRATRGPLDGIRVIEIGHMLMGPYCGMLLADLGAEVIKIEPPEGDIGRSISPHAIGPHNAYFASLNRNKQSVVLDLASDPGKQALAAMVRDAHALVTNLRPSAIRKLGLTYDKLREHNERIVCVALTGFGLDSPHAELPAYDYVIQALTGIMHLTGDPDGPPTKAGFSAVDNSTGIMGAVGLLAKIVEGRGGQVDVAMFDVMVSQLNYVAGAVLNGGEQPARHALSSHPYIVPAQLFKTRDDWLMIFITHDNFWRIFTQRVGHPEWITQPEFATMAARRAHRATVIDALSAMFASETTQHWLDLLASSGVVVSRLASIAEALDSAQAQARGLVVEIESEAGPLKVVGNPIHIDGAHTRYGVPPLLGEHTAAWCGEVST